MKLSFRERAELLGHSLELLDQGIPVTSFITVNNVDQLKTLIRKFASVESNSDLCDLLFGSVPLAEVQDDHSVLGTMRRVNEFIYGDAELSADDRERVRNAFPMQMEATSAPNYTPTAPVIVNTPKTPQIYNYGTVTLNQGIYISFYNTVVTSFTMDTLVRNGNNGNSNIGDFNILGATGANGTPGGTGSNGNAGGNGSGGTCTVSGSEPGDNGGNGGNGTGGATGTAGNPGGVGQPSWNATFVINNSVVTSGAAVLFYTCSGTGGAGGSGGTGGNGGNGGSGGDGANCECTGTSGGNGGSGGSGGSGGRGGDAGNAIDAQGGILIQVPSASVNAINKSSATAPPGAYGQGGASGSGGSAGSGGSGGKGKGGGTNGTGGANGQAGSPGTASQVSGKPGVITIQVS